MSSSQPDEGERWEMPPGDVPEFLRQYQRKHGPSQSAIATQTGTTQAAVSHFLTGRWDTWRILTAVRTATALGLDLSVTIRRRPRRPQA